MKMVIELESLDDLINLIGLAKCVQPKEEIKKDETRQTNLERAQEIYKNLQEKRRLEERERFLNRPIEVLRLRKSAENSLKADGIFYLKDFCRYSISEIKKIPFVGRLTMRTIQETFKANQVTLVE